MSDSSTIPVRVRFAPSPTGPLHIGGVRTALFTWLFARHHGGKFILRIEDTDQKRYDPDAVRLITEGLRWLGIDWDEGPEVGGEFGPYYQSQRSELYQQWANWLVDHDLAYRCYCTAERLEQVRQQQIANKEDPGYDRRCRTLTPAEREKLHAETGGHYVIRFKMPLDGSTTVYDMLRGDIEFDNYKLQDLVLLKSDGFPTYHLANVVDDHFMKISHIMRAEEWIPSAPVHKNLYEGFGWQMPHIAHLPVILNPSGKGKLSKRSVGFTEDGRRVPVLLHEFREGGYLPEAIVNFLTNVGWSFGDDREVFTVQETIERFDLARVNPAGSAFPVEKLDWLNGVYIREMDPKRLAALLKPVFEEAGYTVTDEMLVKVAPLLRERIKTLKDCDPHGRVLLRRDVRTRAAGYDHPEENGRGQHQGRARSRARLPGVAAGFLRANAGSRAARPGRRTRPQAGTVIRGAAHGDHRAAGFAAPVRNDGSPGAG